MNQKLIDKLFPTPSAEERSIAIAQLLNECEEGAKCMAEEDPIAKWDL